MLTRVICRQFAKIVQPKISQYASLYQLADDTASIKNYISLVNNRKLIQTKGLSPQQTLSARFALPITVTQYVKNSKIQLFAHSPRQHKTLPISVNMHTGEINSQSIILEEVQDYYTAEKQNVKSHPCFNKQKFVIPQYKFDGKTLYMFNLPNNITEKNIKQALPNLSIKAINFSYDIFQMPAFAKIILNSEAEMSKYLQQKRDYYEINGKVCYIKSDQDQEKLGSQNRYLYIEGFPSQMTQQNILLELAAFGKVIHAEIPTMIRKNISYKKALQIYQNCQDSPVKINHHRKNGTIQSEYYPPYKPPQLKISRDQFSYDYTNYQSQLEEHYKKKLQFCQNVDIYEDITEKISFVGRGYALVVYSCTQEAQNCYFNLKDFYKIDLIKQQYQFQFDKQYRKKVLRCIDNEYLKQRIKGKKSNQKQRKHDQEQNKKSFSQRMNFQLTLVSGKQLNQEDFPNSHIHVSYRNMQDYKQYAKRNLGKKDVYGKSFDELAQIQLFGRILPKQQSQFNLEVVEEIKPDYNMNFKDIDSRVIPTPSKMASRDLRVKRIKEKSNKKDDSNESEEPQGEVNQQAQIDQTIDQFQGKKYFSTQRVQSNYRPYSPQQKAHRIMRFNQFISKTINEYLGIFSEQSLQRIFKTNKRNYLNLHDVTFANGQPFLNQNQLATILDYHVNSEFAQIALEQFVKKNEIIKANDLNIQEIMLSDLQSVDRENMRYMADTGVVDQIYEWQGDQGQNIDSYINQLNIVEAKFGEQYRKVTENDRDYIVKVKKLDFIYPLERIQKFQKFKQQMEQHIKANPQQYKIVQQHIQKIIETGDVPEQLRQMFGLQQTKLDLDSIMSELGPELGFWKKDLIALSNCSKYSQQEIAADIQTQIEIQKARVKKRPMKASDLAKDPDNIDVREEDGKFKVSKFRQI